MQLAGKPATAPRKVLISIKLNKASSRNFFAGVLRFVTTHPNWDLRILSDPGDMPTELVMDAVRTGTHGVIVASDATIDYTALQKADFPVVTWGFSNNGFLKRRAPCAMVASAEDEIARVGARYLAGIGTFNAFAFVGEPNRAWSKSRETGFLKEMKRLGLAATALDVAFDMGSTADAAQLREFISELPLPAAVMCATDRRAAQVAAACRDLKLEVPMQVAVLGVDNDDFFCESSKPSLSSVDPRHEELGWRAANELDRMMRSRRPHDKARIIRMPPGEVVVRESTRVRPPSAMLVNRAMAFIETNAMRGIEVADVAGHLGVSRRLVEMRFRETRGETIYARITECRIKEVKHLLRTTSMTAAQIATRCGFKTPNHLAHLFKRATGSTMSAWRVAGER